MKIIVEGHEIETHDIVAIKELNSSTEYGFEIKLIGPKSIKISEGGKYDDYSHIRSGKYEQYKKLRDQVEEYWQKDKTDIPILNL